MDVVDVVDVEMPSILVAVITWEEAAVEHLEASTDPVVDAVVVVDVAEQTTGVPLVPCAPIAKEDSVPQSLAQDVTPAAALVSLFPVNLAPL